MITRRSPRRLHPRLLLVAAVVALLATTVAAVPGTDPAVAQTSARATAPAVTLQAPRWSSTSFARRVTVTTHHVPNGSVVSVRVDGRQVATVRTPLAHGQARVRLPRLRAGTHHVSAVVWHGGRSVATSTRAAIVTKRGCTWLPRVCGFPDASSTGVSRGVHLRTHQGDLTVTRRGAVVQNLLVKGSIEVYAANVTIKNVRVVSNGDWWGIGLHGTSHTTITHTQISRGAGGPRLEVGIKDVTGSSTGTKILHTDISGVDTGIQVHEGLVQDNYVHDMAMKPGDHVNGFSSNGSTTPLTIRHNTILDQIDQTDAISLFQDFGLEANRTVSNNLIAGGSYTLYAGGGSKGISHDIHITGNRFSPVFFSTGGVFGPVTAFDSKGARNTWSGNVWDTTERPVSH